MISFFYRTCYLLLSSKSSTIPRQENRPPVLVIIITPHCEVTYGFTEKADKEGYAGNYCLPNKRKGGISVGQYSEMNLSFTVGDSPDKVNYFFVTMFHYNSMSVIMPVLHLHKTGGLRQGDGSPVLTGREI